LIKSANKAINEILQSKSEQYKTITNLNKLVYATAKTIQDIIVPENNKKKNNYKEEEPPWKKRIQAQISKMRKDLSLMTEVLKPTLSRHLSKKKEELYKKYNIRNKKDHYKETEKLKQKIKAKAYRIKRYTERSAQYQQNKQFTENTSKFYNNVLGKKNKVKETPTEENIEKYWKSIWENEKKHNSSAAWIQNEYKKQPQ